MNQPPKYEGTFSGLPTRGKGTISLSSLMGDDGLVTPNWSRLNTRVKASSLYMSMCLLVIATLEHKDTSKELMTVFFKYSTFVWSEEESPVFDIVTRDVHQLGKLLNNDQPDLREIRRFGKYMANMQASILD